MKPYLFILTFLFAFNAQSNNLDSLRVIDSLKIVENSVKIQTLISDMEARENKIIELNNDIVVYRAKEDYFATALEDQGNRYALIVTLSLFILGLITWSNFYYSLNQIKKSNKKKMKKLKSAISENDNKRNKKEIDLIKSLNLTNEFGIDLFEKVAYNNYVSTMNRRNKSIDDNDFYLFLVLFHEGFYDMVLSLSFKNKLTAIHQEKLNSIKIDIEMFIKVMNKFEKKDLIYYKDRLFKSFDLLLQIDKKLFDDVMIIVKHDYIKAIS